MKQNDCLRAILSIDKRNNSLGSFMVLVCYRIGHKLYQRKSPLLRLWRGIKYFIYMLFRLDSQISEKATIGTNIRLPHRGQGVVISAKAVIGSGVTIYHQVTIGVNENLPIEKQPIIIGDNCYLSTGAKIISCRLGDGSKVGPNAVVWNDLPKKSLVVSSMCNKISYYSLRENQ